MSLSVFSLTGASFRRQPSGIADSQSPVSSKLSPRLTLTSLLATPRNLRPGRLGRQPIARDESCLGEDASWMQLRGQAINIPIDPRTDDANAYGGFPAHSIRFLGTQGCSTVPDVSAASCDGIFSECAAQRTGCIGQIDVTPNSQSVVDGN
jgi:hypothetical protein